MIAFSSYNKRDHKILRDVLSITVLNAATSILAGFAIFSILGYIALKQGKEVEDVVTDGPGLVFIVYPEAFITMPAAPVFSCLFFFMLLCLAIDSQFASVEVVITTLEDHFGPFIRRYLRRREILVLIVCVVAFIIGLQCIFEGGIYFFKIIDTYTASISLMLVALCEVVAITWCYGARRLGENVREMTGSPPFMYFIVCWIALSPLLILAIMIFNWVSYSPVTYGDYVFPSWAEGIGWGIASLSLICIPAGMALAIYRAKGHNIVRKLLDSLKAKIDDLVPPEPILMVSIPSETKQYL
jgi:solute carrier family 6 GABA transporter-like protein 6/8/11/12/13